MTFGQVSEVFFMLLASRFLKTIWLKDNTAGWHGRMGDSLSAFCLRRCWPGVWMLFSGILLHGICYDFFFVSGQIYTDYKAGEKIKSSAQGLITLATYGVGMLVGFWLAGKIYDHYTDVAGVQDWKMIWTIPAGIAAAVMVLYALVFKNEKINA